MDNRSRNLIPPLPCAGNRQPIAVWMKTLLSIVAAGLPLLCSLRAVLAQTATAPTQPTQANTQERVRTWWRDRAPGQRPYTVDNKKMPLVAVKGNRFVDPNGQIK